MDCISSEAHNGNHDFEGPAFDNTDPSYEPPLDTASSHFIAQAEVERTTPPTVPAVPPALTFTGNTAGTRASPFNPGGPFAASVSAMLSQRPVSPQKRSQEGPKSSPVRPDPSIHGKRQRTSLSDAVPVRAQPLPTASVQQQASSPPKMQRSSRPSIPSERRIALENAKGTKGNRKGLW